MDKKSGELFSIPLPGSMASSAGNGEAWKKAEDALGKAAGSTAVPNGPYPPFPPNYNGPRRMPPQFHGTGDFHPSPYAAYGGPSHFPPYGGPPSQPPYPGQWHHHPPNRNAGNWHPHPPYSHEQGVNPHQGMWKPAEPKPFQVTPTGKPGWNGGYSSGAWKNRPNPPAASGGNNEPLGQKPFQSFSIGKKLPGSLGSSFVPPSSTAPSASSVAGGGRMPESATRYVERAYLAATSSEDRQKVQEYLEKRLQPMVQAGTVAAVNWDREPLPHERNYQLPGWMPAASLRPSPTKVASVTRRRSPSPSSRSGGKRGRHTPEVDIPSLQTSAKKSKKQKKQDALERKQKAKFENQKKNKKQTAKKTERWSIAEDVGRKEGRARRFADDARLVQPSSRHTRARLVRGTCQNIEKNFFRLTCDPDPSQVRPPEILEKSLENVKEKYKAKVEYRYLSNQLRSIRQDLTVQRIRDRFTVNVYEINARISLEFKDREEFNKCQSQLKLLYSEIENCPNEAEFVAYRLLYYIAMDNTLDISTLLKSLNSELRNNECIVFAIQVRRAVATGNYIRLFKLFRSAPRMCPFIMDLFVDRERKRALKSIFQAYRPTIPLETVAESLGMERDDLCDWLSEMEINYDNDLLDCRLYASKTL